MKDSDSFRKEQDLIFQQMEEMERLEAQALAAAQNTLETAEQKEFTQFIVRLCKAQAFRDLMAVSSDEAKVEIVRACIDNWDTHRKTSVTHK